MKLIDKIREYVQEVVQQEKGKKGDEHDYSHGKFAVAAVVERLIEEYDQPPKLRPMSELPEDKDVILLIECKAYPYEKWSKSFVIGCKRRSTGKIEIEEPETTEYPANYYEGEHRFLGWLYELPNPNDMKL